MRFLLLSEMLLLFFFSCPVIHETSYPADVMRFEIIQTETIQNDIRVEIYRGNNSFERIEEIDGVFCIETARMRGGFTTFLGEKSNIHDPKKYKIIRIEWPRVGQKLVSIDDIRKLPSKIKENQYVHLLDQKTFLASSTSEK